MVDTDSGITFVDTYADNSMKLMEKLVENWAYHQIFSRTSRIVGLIDVKAVEINYQNG